MGQIQIEMEDMRREKDQKIIELSSKFEELRSSCEEQLNKLSAANVNLED